MSKDQLVGAQALVTHKAFALMDAPGCGKSRMVIEAAIKLHHDNKIDTVLVICPAAVRISWADTEFGEIAKWNGGHPISVHSLRKEISGTQVPGYLYFYVCSYEFARDHWEWLAEFLEDRKVMIVADESIKIKNNKAKTTKSCHKLADAIGTRKVVLNGTPGTMLDCWGQYRFLGESSVGDYRNFYHWRAHFAVMMQRPFPKIIKYINHDDFARITSPITLRRSKPADLPPQLFTTQSVTLTPETWRVYQEMKQDMITWVGRQPAMATNVGVQIMRLSQITSGLIGILEVGSSRISHEKLDWLQDWIESNLEADSNFRAIIWCQHRQEIFDAVDNMVKIIPTATIIGGQPDKERRAAIAAFTKEATGPRLLIGQPHAGGLGLNLVQAHDVAFLSRDYSQINREQAEDRSHRRGQEYPVKYIDVLAEGPTGQKTIDHVILRALEAKDDLYKWTASKWLDTLRRL